VVINANKNIISTAIDVFPNPVRNSLNLVIPAEAGLMKCAVYNVNGQKVMEGDLASSDLEVSNSVNGFYMLRLVSPNGDLFYSKFTKQ